MTETSTVVISEFETFFSKDNVVNGRLGSNKKQMS